MYEPIPLIDPNGDRDAWLRARRSALGASDSAAVCGLSPWSSALSVWLDKRGLVPPTPMTPQQRWGLLLEPAVAAEFELHYPLLGVRPSPGWVVSPDCPWMGCTPDRLIDGGVLELKTSRTSEGWGPDGSAEVPEHYLVQVQHQMFVTNTRRAFLAALIGGSDFRTYEVARHEGLIERLLAVGGHFWREHVEPGDPPAPDWSHPRTPELVELLHRPDPARPPLTWGDAEAALADEYARLGARIGEADRERKGIRARLVERLAGSPSASLPDGRTVIHAERARAGYVVDPTTFTELRVKNPRKPRGE